jgi:hypothetical protein
MGRQTSSPPRRIGEVSKRSAEGFMQCVVERCPGDVEDFRRQADVVKGDLEEITNIFSPQVFQRGEHVLVLGRRIFPRIEVRLKIFGPVHLVLHVLMIRKLLETI